MDENTTARQRRAQQTESKYAADLRQLKQDKDAGIQELDDRIKMLKKCHRMERINIKEDFAMQRLAIKTQIERLKDKRADVRHARSCDLPMDGMPDLDDLTTQIADLSAKCIKLDRQEYTALADAEEALENRLKENQEERRAITKHYINQAEQLHEAYLQHVEKNRQLRKAEEGGEGV